MVAVEMGYRKVSNQKSRQSGSKAYANQATRVAHLHLACQYAILPSTNGCPVKRPEISAADTVFLAGFRFVAHTSSVPQQRATACRIWQVSELRNL
jgi:hypothetical protein